MGEGTRAGARFICLRDGARIAMRRGSGNLGQQRGRAAAARGTDSVVGGQCRASVRRSMPLSESADVFREKGGSVLKKPGSGIGQGLQEGASLQIA
jgi:hypothetical protein